MNSFVEIFPTTFSIQIFQRTITPLKIIETEQDYDVQRLAWYISILQSFIKIQQTVFKKCLDKIFNTNISKGRNSAKIC